MPRRELFHPESFIHHVTLNVKNLEESARFYEEVLGLRKMGPAQEYSDMKVVWFEFGSGQQLHLIQSVGPRSDGALVDNRQNHMSISVPSIEDARATIAEFTSETHHAGSNSVFQGQAFFRDPDGHIIEIAELQKSETS